MVAAAMSDAVIGRLSIKETLNMVAATSDPESASSSIGSRDRLSALACLLVPLNSML